MKIEYEKVTTRLWYERDAEAAAEFYVSLLPDSRIERTTRFKTDAPGMPAGSVIEVEFRLAGRPYAALNGRREAGFTDAASLLVSCDGQGEVDRLWDALCDGGTPGRCGWLKDRWGVSWQIAPIRLYELLRDGDVETTGRVFDAMMTMSKIDIETLERAAAG